MKLEFPELQAKVLWQGSQTPSPEGSLGEAGLRGECVQYGYRHRMSWACKVVTRFLQVLKLSLLLNLSLVPP